MSFASPKSLVFLVAVVVLPRPTFAEAANGPSPLRLEYLREPGVSGCPSGPELRAKVAAQLGYDPFSDDAARAVLVRVRKDQREHEAAIAIYDARGEAEGERSLRSGDCPDLIESVALALAVAIDPLGAQRAKPAPVTKTTTVAVTPRTATIVPVDEQSDPPPRVERSLDVEALVGLHLSLATAPSPALGLFAGARVVWPSFTLGLEGRVDLASSLDLGERQAAETSLFAGTLVPCYRYSWFSGCVVVSAGAIRSAGIALPNGRQTTSGWAAVGARTALVLPITPIFQIELRAELVGVLTQTKLLVGGSTVWTSPRIAGLVGIAPMVRFP